MEEEAHFGITCHLTGFATAQFGEECEPLLLCVFHHDHHTTGRLTLRTHGAHTSGIRLFDILTTDGLLEPVAELVERVGSRYKMVLCERSLVVGSPRPMLAGRGRLREHGPAECVSEGKTTSGIIRSVYLYIDVYNDNRCWTGHNFVPLL